MDTLALGILPVEMCLGDLTTGVPSESVEVVPKVTLAGLRL